MCLQEPFFNFFLNFFIFYHFPPSFLLLHFVLVELKMYVECLQLLRLNGALAVARPCDVCAAAASCSNNPLNYPVPDKNQKAFLLQDFSMSSLLNSLLTPV